MLLQRGRRFDHRLRYTAFAAVPVNNGDGQSSAEDLEYFSKRDPSLDSLAPHDSEHCLEFKLRHQDRRNSPAHITNNITNNGTRSSSTSITIDGTLASTRSSALPTLPLRVRQNLLLIPTYTWKAPMHETQAGRRRCFCTPHRAEGSTERLTEGGVRWKVPALAQGGHIERRARRSARLM